MIISIGFHFRDLHRFLVRSLGMFLGSGAVGSCCIVRGGCGFLLYYVHIIIVIMSCVFGCVLAVTNSIAIVAVIIIIIIIVFICVVIIITLFIFIGVVVVTFGRTFIRIVFNVHIHGGCGGCCFGGYLCGGAGMLWRLRCCCCCCCCCCHSFVPFVVVVRHFYHHRVFFHEDGGDQRRCRGWVGCYDNLRTTGNTTGNILIVVMHGFTVVAAAVVVWVVN